MHREAPITMLIGAKTGDKVWRNRLNRECDEEVAVEDGQVWTGNMADPWSG